MAKSIYIINPAGDFPTYFTNEVHTAYGLPPAATIGDLAITTVAAMVTLFCIGRSSVWWGSAGTCELVPTHEPSEPGGAP